MDIQKQVCSLELAKKLKELGVKQESLFYWSKGIGEGSILLGEPDNFNLEPKPMVDTADLKVRYSAFTVAELGEMLPDEVRFEYRDENEYGKRWKLNTFKAREEIWRVEYEWKNNFQFDVRRAVEAETEADARAKMLIYLLENKLLTL